MRQPIRIVVLGSSGAGKTTFAARLGQALGVTHVELDAINWQAGWRNLYVSAPEQFRHSVTEALAADSWISDGNYSGVQDVILARATHIVWLDYSRAVVMRRVIWRSLKRVIGRAELWPGTGNRENFARWLSKEHPIRWAWNTYNRRRTANTMMLRDPALAHAEKFRLFHPHEAEALTRFLTRN